jgi:hypothetical protein
MAGKTKSDDPGEDRRPLLLIKGGDASPEEVAALVVVLQSMSAGAAGEEQRASRSEWSAPHRSMGRSLPSGPGAWRSSALPR